MASNPKALPRMAGLGTARLGPCARADTHYTRLGLKIGGEGPWQMAWPMEDVQLWDEPVPCKGAQGFWRWPFPVPAAEVVA